ncbi:segregation and condensation protein A [Micromonospora sp. NPDC049051]|uniref:segregation and condensation protein A n=1 Tax=unclassified Micromonospora TaxID=2617518 RepID=UPI00371C555C
MDYGLPVTAPPLDPPTTPEQPPVRAAGAASEVSTAPTGEVPTGPAGEPGMVTDQAAGEPEAADPAGISEAADAAGESEATVEGGGFTVRLANFTGPFDLLLQLIGKHKLDVTEVALHRVTDEFIAYIRAMGDQWDLDEASEFLLIAATLLDLKAARLLPAAEVENEEDLALLEARDLLFARLLQYKAYKEAAAHIAALEEVGGRRYPRAVTLEPRYAEALPDLVLGIGPQRLLKLAIKAMTPKPVPEVSIAHVHMVRVSVREHAGILTERLRRAGTATFSLLCADCEATLEVVARFLALLELYREGLVAFVQEQALEELTVRWTGPADGGPDLHIDEYAGTPAEPAPTSPEPAGSGPLPAASAERPVPDGTADETGSGAVVGVAAEDTGSAAAHSGSAAGAASGTAHGAGADENGTATTEERAG